jgi:hypothetical protein
VLLIRDRSSIESLGRVEKQTNAESTLQRDEECSVEGAIAGVGTVTHADHDDALDIVVAA